MKLLLVIATAAVLFSTSANAACTIGGYVLARENCDGALDLIPLTRDPLAGYSMAELKKAASVIGGGGHFGCKRERRSDSDHCDAILENIPKIRERYKNYEPPSMRAAIMENLRDSEALVEADKQWNSDQYDSVDVQIAKLHERNKNLPAIFKIIQDMHGGNLR